MRTVGRFAWMAGAVLSLSATAAVQASAGPQGGDERMPPQAERPEAARPAEPQHPVEEVVLKDLSLDKPLVLDENVNYRLRGVTVAGVFDCAALTLAGRINSVDLDHCSFGRVWTGDEGKAAGIECAGAVVKTLTATDTSFFDAENQLASLKECAFGRVRFERCHSTTSERFLRQIYAAAPWRTWTPVTEFYHIDRLELLDNEYSNTTVIIHPSVRQVIIRGPMPGLQIENPQSTQLIQLQPGQLAENIPAADAAMAAAAPGPSPKG